LTLRSRDDPSRRDFAVRRFAPWQIAPLPVASTRKGSLVAVVNKVRFGARKAINNSEGYLYVGRLAVSHAKAVEVVPPSNGYSVSASLR
jgi:hypothetical protein